MSDSLGNNTTQCTLPLLPISIGPGTLTGYDAGSFCIPPCCVPCPPQNVFFPRYVPVFEALDVVNAISIVLVVAYCLLWTTILYRSPKFRLRSRYVVGTAVALFLWHLPGFITLVGKPDNVLCDNSITRGSDANHLCLAQGFLFIFSTHAVVLWGVIRIAYVHMQMRKSSIFYLHHDVLINNLIAWGISAIFATIALTTKSIGYVSSHYCGPTLDKGKILLWIPLIVYVGIATLLQIWTLVEIEEAVRKALKPGNAQETEERPPSGTFENVPTPQTYHLGTRSEITDFSVEETVGGRTETSTTMTFDSRSPMTRNGRRPPPAPPTPSRQSRSSRHTSSLSLSTILIKPQFSQNTKDRGKFIWELFKLNYRMLISLSLTSFVAVFISVNSLLFQYSVYHLPNSSEAFVEWINCIQTGGTMNSCSGMANNLFPLSFWRDATADTARASFGIIFFIVEVTKGDFWRAMRERHPFALTLARGPRRMNTSTVELTKMTPKGGWPTSKLAPILPSRLRFSFMPQSSSDVLEQQGSTPTSSSQLSEFGAVRSDRKTVYSNTYPPTNYHRHSLNAPRVYLHTPTWELEERNEKKRRMSLPTTPNTALNSAMHMPVSAGSSSTPPSTRASLLSIATNSLALESRLQESHLREK